MPRVAVTRKAPDVMNAPAHETHSTDFQIGDQSTITDKTPRNDVSREKSTGQRLFGARLKRDGELVLLDGVEVSPEYLAELAFYEEPVTIIINPSTHKNAASIYENWSNGRGAEVLVSGKWVIIKDLPVSQKITVKRKIVEQIIRARVMGVQTIHEEPPVASPRNEIIRTSSFVHSFSVVRDDNPRGPEWLEMAYARPL